MTDRTPSSPEEYGDEFGKIFRPEIMPRTEPMTLISKNDYLHMGTLNRFATICLSLGTGFLFLTLEFLWSSFDDSELIRAELAFIIVTTLVSAIFYIGGWQISVKRKDMWESVWNDT